MKSVYIVTFAAVLICFSGCDALYNLTYDRGEVVVRNEASFSIQTIEIVSLQQDWSNANLLDAALAPGGVWFQQLPTKGEFKLRIGTSGDAHFPMVLLDFSSVDRFNLTVRDGGIE